MQLIVLGAQSGTWAVRGAWMDREASVLLLCSGLVARSSPIPVAGHQALSAGKDPKVPECSMGPFLGPFCLHYSLSFMIIYSDQIFGEGMINLMIDYSTIQHGRFHKLWLKNH